jgi:hypothetical protein
MRPSSDQQDDQDDQQYGANPTADVRSTVVEAATTKQK